MAGSRTLGPGPLPTEDVSSLGWAQGLPTARWPEGTKEPVTLNKPCPSESLRCLIHAVRPNVPPFPLCPQKAWAQKLPDPAEGHLFQEPQAAPLSNCLQCGLLGTMVRLRGLTFASSFMFKIMTSHSQSS